MAKRSRKETRAFEEQLRREQEQERKRARVTLMVGVFVVLIIFIYALYDRVLSNFF